MKNALAQAIEAAGGQNALARTIGVKQQLVWYWLHKSGRCPAEFAAAIEAASGISRHDLRPDIFGPPSSQAATPPAGCGSAPLGAFSQGDK